MLRNALQTVNSYSMFSNGSRIIVGFSGGADSVALLSFLLELKQDFNLEIVPCHINHQLRGDEALRDELFCREFCKKNNLELVVFREDISGGAAREKLSIEEYARKIRYQRFNQLITSSSDKIATAHNANDLAETLIFHIARGTGVKGLISIPPVRDNIIRPLLYCSRLEIENYCRENNLNFVTDSSNLSDDYSRNKIRHHILPKIQELNPAFLKSVERLSKQAEIEQDFWEEFSRKNLNDLQLADQKWNRIAFLQLHSAVQNRIISYLLEINNLEISNKKVYDILEIIQNGGALELKKNFYLKSNFQAFSLEKAPDLQGFFCVEAKFGKNKIFDGKFIDFLKIDKDKFEFFANISSKDLKNIVDYDKIRGNLYIRQKMNGDCIQFKAESKPKSFKKLLNQNKISLEERSRLAVICDDAGVVWLEGFGARFDVLPDDATSNFVLISVFKELLL